MSGQGVAGARALPLGLVLLSVTGFQLGAALARPLFEQVGASGTSALRLGFAALILCAVIRPWRWSIAPGLHGHLLGYGLCLAGLNLFFYLAIRSVPLGLTVAIEFLGPLGLAIAGSRRPVDLLWAMLAAVGIGLLLPITPFGAKLDPVGLGFAVASACCWTGYIIFGQKVGRALPAQAAVAIGVAVAALAVLPIGLAQGGAGLLRFDVWPMALLVAIVSGALPYLFEKTALKRLPMRVFGVLMSLEPAFGAVFGFALLGQHLTAVQVAAILAIMAASAGVARLPGPSAAPIN